MGILVSFAKKIYQLESGPRNILKKTMHGPIDPTESDEFPHQDSDRLRTTPKVPLMFRHRFSYEIRWDSVGSYEFPIGSDRFPVGSDNRIDGPGLIILFHTF